MTRGKGWFQERGFDRTVFEIEIEEIVEGVVRGRVFNEVSPRGGKMPLSTISGTLNGEIIQAEKFYSGISHSHIYYRLKKRLHTCLAVRFLFTVARRLTSTACMRLPAEQWRLCLIRKFSETRKENSWKWFLSDSAGGYCNAFEGSWQMPTPCF